MFESTRQGHVEVRIFKGGGAYPTEELGTFTTDGVPNAPGDDAESVESVSDAIAQAAEKLEEWEAGYTKAQRVAAARVEAAEEAAEEPAPKKKASTKRSKK